MATSSENEIVLTARNSAFVKELAEMMSKTPEEMVNMIVASFKAAGWNMSQIKKMLN